MRRSSEYWELCGKNSQYLGSPGIWIPIPMLTRWEGTSSEQIFIYWTGQTVVIVGFIQHKRIIFEIQRHIGRMLLKYQVNHCEDQP